VMSISMSGDVAERIRRWPEQNVAPMPGGSIEGSRGSIGALM